MADLRRKYVCRLDVALVETHSFGAPFPFSGGIEKRTSLNPNLSIEKCYTFSSVLPYRRKSLISF